MVLDIFLQKGSLYGGGTSLGSLEKNWVVVVLVEEWRGLGSGCRRLKGEDAKILRMKRVWLWGMAGKLRLHRKFDVRICL